MIDAYAYLRVSGDEQADRGLPIAGQREAVQAHADAHDIRIVRWFIDEARPGSSDNRAEFQAMMREAHADPAPVGAVILWSWSRFARDSDDAHFWKASLRRHGLEVLSVAEPVPDNLPAGFEYVLESAIHWSDQRRLEEISHDARRGQQALARAGYIPTGKAPPPGYRREWVEVQVNGRATRAIRWVIDPEKRPLARLAWEMRLGGASYQEIWRATHLYKQETTYTSFFSNPVYKGEPTFGGTVVPVEPIVTPEEWAAVNRDRDKRRSGAYARRTYLLTGLIRCARCGASVVGSSTRSVKNRTGGRPTYAFYPYYRCHRVRSHACDLPQVSARKLEGAVLDALFDEVLTPATVAEMRARLEERRRAQEDELSPQVRVLEGEIARLEGAIGQLLDALEASASPALAKRLEQREGELAQARAMLAALQREAAAEQGGEIRLEELRAVLREGLEEWEPSRRRALIALFIDGIELGDQEARVRFRLPFPVGP